MEKGAIGEFASKYLRELIDEIKNLESQSLIPVLKKKCSIIGDSFIKKQLETMIMQYTIQDTNHYSDFVEGLSLIEKKRVMELLQKSIENNEAIIDD